MGLTTPVLLCGRRRGQLCVRLCVCLRVFVQVFIYAPRLSSLPVQVKLN